MLGSSKAGSMPPGRSTMIVLAPTSYEWFKEWQEEPEGKRSNDYETLKNSFVEASLSVVLKLFPQLEGKVGGAPGWLWGQTSWSHFRPSLDRGTKP